MKFKPRPYTNRLIKLGTSLKSFNLFADMGLGKTAIALTVLQENIKKGRVKQALIIAPNQVCQGTWQNELAKWDHLDVLQQEGIKRIEGNAKRRLKILGSGAKLFLINYELVKWLVVHFKEAWPFNVVIADESSMLRNPKSERFKALRDIRGFTDSWINLSGMPAPNGVSGIWSQNFLNDQGERLFTNFTNFEARWFHKVQDGYGSLIPKQGATEEILKRICDVSVSLRAEDYLTMPKEIINRVSIKMPVTLMEKYNKLERDLFVMVQNHGIDCANSGSLINKCRQFANGNVYKDKLHKEYIKVHTLKLEALESIVNEHYGEPILIAYHFKHDVAEIQMTFKKFEITTSAENIETRWNKKEIPGLLIPAGGGMGLNLQYGGSVIVWYGGTFDLEAWTQLNRRLARPGQTKPVFIYVLQCKGTIDEIMEQRIMTKEKPHKLLMKTLKLKYKDG